MSTSKSRCYTGSSYKYTSAPNNGLRQQPVEVVPSVCLTFSPVTNDVVVNLLRRKLGRKLLQESFSGWKIRVAMYRRKIRLTFEEVFAHYAVTHRYDGVSKVARTKKKTPVATMTKDSIETLRETLKQEEVRKNRWHHHVTEFYKKYHPQKAHFALVLNLLKMYKGKEEHLFRKIHKNTM